MRLDGTAGDRGRTAAGTGEGLLLSSTSVPDPVFVSAPVPPIPPPVRVKVPLFEIVVEFGVTPPP